MNPISFPPIDPVQVGISLGVLILVFLIICLCSAWLSGEGP